MSHDTKMRTSVWVNGTRPKPESPEDMDTPLDFSSKKRRSPDMADDTASEGGASSTSSCHRADSPPASMVAANGNLNPLLRFGAVGNYLANNPGGMPAFQFPSMLTDQRSKTGNKPIRPFKAYPRDPLSLPLGLYGLPMNLGLSSASMLESFSPQMFTNGSKDLFAQYKNALQNGHGRKNDTFSQTTSAPKSSRKSTKQMDAFVSSSVKNPKRDSNPSPVSMASGSPNAAVDSTASTTTSSPATAGKEHAESKTPEPETDEDGKGKKRARSVPDDVKDESYWERRRKNNEAAKRSRDSRRAKEDEIAVRATLLEAENQRLRAQVMAMKNEIDKLHCMLLTN